MSTTAPPGSRRWRLVSAIAFVAAATTAFVAAGIGSASGTFALWHSEGHVAGATINKGGASLSVEFGGDITNHLFTPESLAASGTVTITNTGDAPLTEFEADWTEPAEPGWGAIDLTIDGAPVAVNWLHDLALEPSEPRTFDVATALTAEAYRGIEPDSSAGWNLTVTARTENALGAGWTTSHDAGFAQRVGEAEYAELAISGFSGLDVYYSDVTDTYSAQNVVNFANRGSVALTDIRPQLSTSGGTLWNSITAVIAPEGATGPGVPLAEWTLDGLAPGEARNFVVTTTIPPAVLATLAPGASTNVDIVATADSPLGPIDSNTQRFSQTVVRVGATPGPDGSITFTWSGSRQHVGLYMLRHDARVPDGSTGNYHDLIGGVARVHDGNYRETSYVLQPTNSHVAAAFWHSQWFAGDPLTPHEVRFVAVLGTGNQTMVYLSQPFWIWSMTSTPVASQLRLSMSHPVTWSAPSPAPSTPAAPTEPTPPADEPPVAEEPVTEHPDAPATEAEPAPEPAPAPQPEPEDPAPAPAPELTGHRLLVDGIDEGDWDLAPDAPFELPPARVPGRLWTADGDIHELVVQVLATYSDGTSEAIHTTTVWVTATGDGTFTVDTSEPTTEPAASDHTEESP